MPDKVKDRQSKAALTPAQRKAVELLRVARQPGVLTTSKSVTIDGQPWIHWMTAYALYDKGLVHIERYGEEDAEIHLLWKGHWG